MNLSNGWPYIYIVWPYTTGKILVMFNLYFEIKQYSDGKIPNSLCG